MYVFSRCAFEPSNGADWKNDLVSTCSHISLDLSLLCTKNWLKTKVSGYSSSFYGGLTDHCVWSLSIVRQPNRIFPWHIFHLFPYRRPGHDKEVICLFNFVGFTCQALRLSLVSVILVIALINVGGKKVSGKNITCWPLSASNFSGVILGHLFLNIFTSLIFQVGD